MWIKSESSNRGVREWESGGERKGENENGGGGELEKINVLIDGL